MSQRSFVYTERVIGVTTGAAGVSATTSAAVAGAGALMGWLSSEGGN